MTDQDTRPNGFLCVYDPGLLTGYCKIMVNYGDDSRPMIDIVDVAELTLGEMYERFVTGQAVSEADILVMEAFTINAGSAKKTFQPTSLHLIGLATAHLYVAGRSNEPILQYATDAKTFCPNERLREYNMWHKGGEGHARDALRHAVKWLFDNGYGKDVLARRTP